MDARSIRAVTTAAREATHAASNLAAVATLGLVEDDPSREPLLKASMLAAEAAFVLDDIYRRNNGSPTTLHAAEGAIARAAAALESTREMLQKSRSPVPVRATGHAADVEASTVRRDA